VGEQVTNVHLAAIEMDGRDEAIFVASNVEYDDVFHSVSGWEGGTQGIKTVEITPLHDFEPVREGAFAVGVLLPKFT
jgi:hypothetical protein